MTLTGGDFTLDCQDDAIHSNADVNIAGGTYQIATGDDGVHADENVAISGGTIVISASYEGIEGQRIEISGGEIDATASDDGLNAAGGDSGDDTRRSFMQSSGNNELIISGNTDFLLLQSYCTESISIQLCRRNRRKCICIWS